MKLMLIESNDEGVLKISKVDVSSIVKCIESLVAVFMPTEEYYQEFIDNHNFNIKTTSNEDAIKFFNEQILTSFVDGDSSSAYKLYDANTFETVVLSSLDFTNPLIDISISTRTPEKWFIVDSQTGDIFKNPTGQNFVSATIGEAQVLRGISYEKIEELS